MKWLMNGFALLAYGAVWFAVILACDSVEKGKTTFANNHYPEVVWTGPLKEKYRIGDEYTFVMLVDGEYRKLENVAVNAYHNIEVGETTSMIVQKEQNKPSGYLIMLIAGGFIMAVFVEAFLLTTAGVGFAMFVGQWLPVDAVTFFTVIVGIIVLRAVSSYSDHQLERLREAKLKRCDIGLFIPWAVISDELVLMKWVYLINGQYHYGRKNAVVAKLKG